MIFQELFTREKSLADGTAPLACLPVLGNFVPEAVVHARKMLPAAADGARNRLAHFRVRRHVHLASVLVREHAVAP